MSNLISREQHYIDLLLPSYNINQKAGSRLGYKHSKETRDTRRGAKKGRKLFSEVVAKSRNKKIFFRGPSASLPLCPMGVQRKQKSRFLLSSNVVRAAWSKRIRTFVSRHQRPMPYHLAILQKGHKSTLHKNEITSRSAIGALEKG